jgi:hypothetical protein
MRRFYLQRTEDESGVSGTGRVAEGVEFDDGAVAMQWLSHKTSITFFRNIRNLRSIHGHGGKTKVVWIDNDTLENTDVASSTT